MSKDSKKGQFSNPVKYSQEYEDYKYWRSLPALWKKMSQKDLEDKFGIDDEKMLRFLSYRTQGDFAKAHGVCIETLSDWNKRIELEGNEYLEENRKWASKLNKNVMMAHYNKLVRKFDPVSAELWYKVVDGFNEKREVEMTGKLSLVELARQALEDDTDTNETTT